MMGEVRVLRAVPYDYRLLMVMVIVVACYVQCLMTPGCITFHLPILVSFFISREKNPDLFEKMQRTQTSDAPEPGVNDDIIVRLGPKCDSARSAVSAECFR